MIWFIKWEIIEINNSNIIILTKSWIWYEIIINDLIYSKLIKDKETSLFIYDYKTENSQSLFWFIESEEKNLFKELIKISWVGWKHAMNIISLWIDKITEAIFMWNKEVLESVKWVWKKMTEKIILDLKDKDIIKSYNLNNPWEKFKNNWVLENKKDIIDSLVNMWYNSFDIEKVLKELPEEIKDMWNIIWYVIKKLS